MSIKITADSIADFTPEQLQLHNIEIIPLMINMGDRAYTDARDIHPADIFRHVDAGGDLPKTSAVSIQEFHDLFSRLAPLHEAVVHIDSSPAISSCYQNACLAAQDFDNVYVVDSGALSAGEGMVAVAAAEFAETGASGKEVFEFTRAYAARMETTFIVDRLDYLYKGGRCTGVAAFGANLLKIKPSILQDSEGKLVVGKKYRGSFTKALCNYARDRIAGRDNIDLKRCVVVHPDAPREAVDAVLEEIRQLAPFGEVIEMRTGCTIASHCGPATVGVMFARK